MQPTPLPTLEELEARYLAWWTDSFPDEIEAIMADLNPFRDLLEQAGSTVSRPDEPSVPESMEPAAVVPPTRRQLMMLASDMGMASIDEAVMKFALAAIARWGRPATSPAPAVVAVAASQRPWEREGWCDTDGRCWLHFPDRGIEPLWRLTDPLLRSRYHSHCLPAHALPLPEEVEHG